MRGARQAFVMLGPLLARVLTRVPTRVLTGVLTTLSLGPAL